ncbi:MAG: DUF4192 domain-containing protein [Nocardioidaceae bacterium]|nr:MAG: DUF4192 domain-containing protein [Nocardioidaceae bacterium]
MTFDLGAHPLVARAVFDGQVTFSSRAGVVASLAPVDDLMRRRMRKLTVDATEQFGVDLDSLRSGQGRSQPLRVGEVQLGRHVDSLMCAAIDSGQPMTDVDAATTLLGLQAPKIRALVRHRICRVNAASYVTVLSDLTRRSPRTMTAPVAGLLAFAAWLSGNGALAWVAIDRTRQDDPAEPLAACVAEFLTGALAPRHYRDRSDPELYREFYPER